MLPLITAYAAGALFFLISPIDADLLIFSCRHAAAAAYFCFMIVSIIDYCRYAASCFRHTPPPLPLRRLLPLFDAMMPPLPAAADDYPRMPLRFRHYATDRCCYATLPPRRLHDFMPRDDAAALRVYADMLDGSLLLLTDARRR